MGIIVVSLSYTAYQCGSFIVLKISPEVFLPGCFYKGRLAFSIVCALHFFLIKKCRNSFDSCNKDMIGGFICYSPVQQIFYYRKTNDRGPLR